ncbi:MAG: hypothetical protein HYT87_13155 [Nitrospirae bacterium]|nr:hypothetical protein [Nitrospirota bacterium]
MEQAAKNEAANKPATLSLWGSGDPAAGAGADPTVGPRAEGERGKPPLALKRGDIWPVFTDPQPCCICSTGVTLEVERAYALIDGKPGWKYTAKGCCGNCGDSIRRDLPEMTDAAFEPPYWAGVFHAYILEEIWTPGTPTVRQDCIRRYLRHELGAGGEEAAFQADLKHLVPRDIWPKVSDFFRRVDRRWVVQDPVGAAEVMTREGRWCFQVENGTPQEELAAILAARRNATHRPPPPLHSGGDELNRHTVLASTVETATSEEKKDEAA